RQTGRLLVRRNLRELDADTRRQLIGFSEDVPSPRGEGLLFARLDGRCLKISDTRRGRHDVVYLLNDVGTGYILSVSLKQTTDTQLRVPTTYPSLIAKLHHVCPYPRMGRVETNLCVRPAN